MKEKEILSFDEIKKGLSKIKDSKDKVGYLKEFLEDEDYKDKRKDLVKEYVPLLLKEPLISYNLIYDSLNEGLEPIYFWVLDFMSDSSPAGLGLNVWKGPEEFEASVTSGYFGEMGQRSTLMQQKAMEYLGTVNNLIKSILNLIYDLKEFEIKLKPYDELRDENLNQEQKRAALHSLKGVWMDQVDARKGRGSINLLVQDLQFITLRDAFFYIDKPEQVNKDLDLNERVKNILRRKLEEFDAWKIYSEKEIRKRYEIEKIYLKSQYGTLKIYGNWIKPYLIAAQRLKMRDTTSKGLMNPNIVNAFSNMEIEIKIYGKKEIKPSAIHESFKEIELDKKYYSIIEIIMKFRSVPSSLSGQGGRQYIHAGRTDIAFNAFAIDNVDLEALESFELYEDIDLIDEYVGGSLKRLEEELDQYLREPAKASTKKKEKIKPFIENPFRGLFDGFKEIYDPLKGAILPKRRGPGIAYKELEEVTTEKSKDQAYKIYNAYKKTHGMLST